MTMSDTIVLGRVATLAGDAGFSWAGGLAVAGGRVIASGAREEIAGLVGRTTTTVELAPDEVAVPGLTDAHLHLAETALAGRRVDIAAAPSPEAALAEIAAAHHALEPDRWLEGKGWDADRWGGWPTARDLEVVAPGRRVALWAHDHHALWASAAALREAGIDAATDDPPGGVIRRDETGAPTGVLHEAAARLVTSRIPLPGWDEIREAVRAFQREVLALGVVAIHDPGGLSLDPSVDRSLRAYRELAAAGELALRLHACVRPEQLSHAIERGFRSGQPLGDDPLGRLHAGWLKCFADGTLGSRTAALLEPLDPLPGEPPPPNDGFGVWMTEPEELERLVTRAGDGGIATMIHAIGDAAVRVSLDVLGGTVGRVPLVPRLEHVQLVATSDLERFARLGIAASVQPVHIRSDAEKARRLWGERAESRGYPFGSLARSGALVPFGTDAPVEPIDPWPGLACAVTRQSPDEVDGPPLGAGQTMSLDRALRAQCLDGPLSAGEQDRGRLVPGHRADLVVIPAAGLREPAEAGGPLASVRPRLVLMDGEVAFEA
jgi:hypothetical protein